MKLFLLLVLLLLPVSFFGLSEQSNFWGQYEGLLAKVDVPSDQKTYGDFKDSGYYRGTTYAGRDVPAGYWVYVAPTWFIWKTKVELSKDDLLFHASMFGKYKTLLKQMFLPEDARDDGSFTLVREDGFYEATTYKGQSCPAGYWTYAAKTWFIWKEKDLTNGRYRRLETSFESPKGPLTFQIEFIQGHEEWASGLKERLPIFIRTLEDYSGVPFPGKQPYIISESNQLGLLGLASANRLILSPEPGGSLWTLAHELIHIWNGGGEVQWVKEGLANYLSYRMLIDEALLADEPQAWTAGNFQRWYSAWQKTQGSREDLPLYTGENENYGRLPQGKTMAFLAVLHQRFGFELLLELFQASLQGARIDPAWLKKHLEEDYQFRDSASLFSGWLEKGPYLVGLLDAEKSSVLLKP